ncbi:GAP family protein [Arsenicicoccus cauae]|uniref:GAP family protein n=1 Tax=Arsenicicoccus cauae TaxID=2663847 RepID=UPI00370D2CE9
MTLALLGPLVLLALIDATSFGTLMIPLWLMLAPGRIRATRVLVFLGTIATSYWVLGLLLSAGAVTVLDDLSSWLDTETGRLVRTVVGVGLIAIGILLPGNRRSRSERERGGGARVSRWRARAMGVDASGWGTGALVGLALAAATVEAASMLPYLAAIGMLSTAPLSMAGRGVVLVGYCLLMIAPALVLLALRLGLGTRIEPALQRISAWMERQSGETVAWIIAIVGVLVLRGAVWG